MTWRRDYTACWVAALVRARSGPKRPSKLDQALRARIVELDARGLTLLEIAGQTAVSTATVLAALGRVRSVTELAVPSAQEQEQATDAGVTPASRDDRDDDVPQDAQDGGAELVVLAAPVPRAADRAAARFGDLVAAPVVITQGAQLPLAGLLLALPALEMTGLLGVAEEVLPPMHKGFYGLRATLQMGVSSPRA